MMKLGRGAVSAPFSLRKIIELLPRLSQAREDRGVEHYVEIRVSSTEPTPDPA